MLWLSCANPTQAATVVVDGAQTFQTIEGFGVNANSRSWSNDELKPVLDALIDQAGVTLFRVLHDNTDWETFNDNGAPDVMNWDYYAALYSSAEFQKMWDLIAYLNQRGLNSGISLNFQGGGPAWMGSRYLNPGYEAEWAEMMASLFIYARNQQHLMFGLVEPTNEPDNTSDARTQGILMSTDQYLTAMRKLAQLLDTNGLSDLRFVGPDLAGTNPDWMSAMMADPILMEKLSHFGLHSYEDNGGGSDGIYDFLQQSSYPDRTFWMTEYNTWCSSCETCEGGNDSWTFARSAASYLLSHLANGASAGIVWEGYDSFYALSGCWSYWGLLAVDDVNAPVKTYTPRKGFYTFSQFSKFVRPWSRRIAVSSDPASPLSVVAFYQLDTGQVTLVGINPTGRSVPLSGTLASLPEVPSFDLYYTSSSANVSPGGNFPVSSGTFSATVPADCVFTLVGFGPGAGTVAVQVVSPHHQALFAAPAIIPIQANALTTTGEISQVTFFSGNNKLGEASAPPFTFTWTNVPAGIYTLTARATNSQGASGVSAPVQVSVAGPMTSIHVAPTNATVVPYGAQQFIATARDALGTVVSPPPPFSWSVSGGGVFDSNGLFTAAGEVGGPFAVTVTSGDFTGTAGVTISADGKLVLPPQAARAVRSLALLTVTNTAVAGPFAAQLATNTLNFTYPDRGALLADGWDFLATSADGSPRDTEVTDGAVISYDQVLHPGSLRIPCDTGDLWGSANNTQNHLFRSLPPDWVSVRLACSLAPQTDYQQVQLGLYQDDDNYLQIGLAHNSQEGDQRITMDEELDAVPDTFAAVSLSLTNLQLRLDRKVADETITGFCSANGTNWMLIGAANQPFADVRLSIWSGGSLTPYDSGSPDCDLYRLEITTSNAVPTALTYNLLNAPAGVSIDTNGVITWTPSEAQAPSTNLIITVVTDNGAPPLSATNSFTVVLTQINRAPILPNLNDTNIAELSMLVVTNTAADSNLPPNHLSYRLIDPPDGAVIDTNGVIIWTLTEAQGPSTNRIISVVTDDGVPPLSATNAFTVVVTEVNSAPVLPPQNEVLITALSVLVVTNTAADSDLPPNNLTYRLIGPPEGAAIDANGVVTWTPTQGQGASTNRITTIVTDDGVPPLSATNTFAVVVVEVPKSPAIQGLALSDNVLTINWTAQVGRTYRLQYKEALSQTNWLDLPVDVVATGPTASAFDTISTSPARFYRVLLVR